MITKIKYKELLKMAFYAGISIEEYLDELKKHYPEIEIIYEETNE